MLAVSNNNNNNNNNNNRNNKRVIIDLTGDESDDDNKRQRQQVQVRPRNFQGFLLTNGDFHQLFYWRNLERTDYDTLYHYHNYLIFLFNQSHRQFWGEIGNIISHHKDQECEEQTEVEKQIIRLCLEYISKRNQYDFNFHDCFF